MTALPMRLNANSIFIALIGLAFVLAALPFAMVLLVLSSSIPGATKFFDTLDRILPVSVDGPLGFVLTFAVPIMWLVLMALLFLAYRKRALVSLFSAPFALSSYIGVALLLSACARANQCI